jgi:hypothetical protein
MSSSVWARSGRNLVVATMLAIAGVLAAIALAPGARDAAQAQATRESLIVTSPGPRDVEIMRPETVHVGPVDLTLRNTGDEPVDMGLVRLRPGVTLDELRDVTSRSAAVPDALVSIETSQTVDPGATFQTTVRLAPATYVALGNIPEGKGLGPAVEFEAVGPPTGAPAPKADARIRLYDYGIIGPARIRGSGTLRIANIGNNDHFLVGIRLNRGVSAARVARGLVSGAEDQGPPPGTFVSLIGLVSPGSDNAIRIHLPPGRYVVACFYADRHSAGRSHNTFGMVKRLTVTR